MVLPATPYINQNKCSRVVVAVIISCAFLTFQTQFNCTTISNSLKLKVKQLNAAYDLVKYHPAAALCIQKFSLPYCDYFLRKALQFLSISIHSHSQFPNSQNFCLPSLYLCAARVLNVSVMHTIIANYTSTISGVWCTGFLCEPKMRSTNRYRG